jgi:DNA repair ATPase RecN
MSRKLFNLFLSFAVFLGLNSFTNHFSEEETELKRPGNIGDSGVDDFVNQSFDVYEATISTDKNLETIEKDLVKIEEEGNKIKQDADILKRLYLVQKEIRSRDDKIKELDNKAVSMAENAKNMKPVTKAPKAVKNVNSATKALKIAEDHTPKQVTKTQELIDRAEKMVEK